MQMTEEEICRSFKQAKDKNGQIRILAELNACNVVDITGILADNGLISGVLPKEKRVKSQPKPQKKVQGKFNWDAAAVNRLLELKQMGLSPLEIAERLGVSKASVASKLNRLREAGQLNQPERAAAVDDGKMVYQETETKAEAETACRELLGSNLKQHTDISTGKFLHSLCGLVELAGFDICSRYQCEEEQASVSFCDCNGDVWLLSLEREG